MQKLRAQLRFRFFLISAKITPTDVREGTAPYHHPNPVNSSHDKSKTILYVDDEATGLQVRRMLLESQGYAVITAENGQAALDLLSSQNLDLVVLDYSMPDMDGDLVAHKMKEIRPDLPIIMLSAYVDLPQGTLASVERSLTKGESPAVLLDSIAQLLSNGRNISQATA